MGLAFSATADEPRLITFNAPGAGTAAGQGTLGLGINSSGRIEGYYLDARNVFHSFVRHPNGTITTFDVPGAGADAFQGTLAFGLTDSGRITGYYLDGGKVIHGFLRTEHGTITTFDAPGAGTSSFQGTLAGNIAAGEISGAYVDTSNVFHGFLRARDGTFITFDAPAREQALARVHSPPFSQASTTRGQSRHGTLTQLACCTATCAIPAASSRRSMSPVLGLRPARAPRAELSIGVG